MIDSDAVTQWLQNYDDRKQTHYTFSRQAIRFMMWLDHHRGENKTNLATVTEEDVNEYILFLLNPHKISMEIIDRFGSLTRKQPFAQPQSQESIRSITNALKLLFKYLYKVGYVAENPFLNMSLLSGTMKAKIPEIVPDCPQCQSDMVCLVLHQGVSEFLYKGGARKSIIDKRKSGVNWLCGVCEHKWKLPAVFQLSDELVELMRHS